MLNTKGSIIYVLFLIQIHFADSARTGLQKICTNASGAVRAAMAHAPVELTGLVWDASAPQRIRRQALPEPSRGMHPMYMTALFVSVDARGVAMGDERSHNRDSVTLARGDPRPQAEENIQLGDGGMVLQWTGRHGQALVFPTWAAVSVPWTLISPAGTDGPGKRFRLLIVAYL
eukprot:m.473302 g.473302  ORF g.473302 m.473302 type:complete len:174 (-) comp21664_c0_seq27:1823-2344(-)